MQTFLPFPEFDGSARVLDDRRLGKQRVEVLQVLRALHLQDYGWGNHPAVTMWRGHTAALVSYGIAVVDQWCARGHGDSTRANIAEFCHPDPVATQDDLAARGLLPAWLGQPAVHRSHRSALLRKDPGHYRRYFDDVPDDLEYAWPDPPAAPRPPGRRSAWAVRLLVDDERIAVAALPPGVGSGRPTKRQRQVDRFRSAMAPGDLVAVPGDDEVRLVVVTGAAMLVEGLHVRSVEVLGSVWRRELRFPAALQDPQQVFALYDEPILERRVADAGEHG